jgi:hypothetical protein
LAGDVDYVVENICMEKQVIEYVIKIIGASDNPDYEEIAQATLEFCEQNRLNPDVSPDDIKEIHEIVALFEDHDVALVHLSTLSDDITDVTIPFRNLKEKGIQKVESKVQELELFKVIYDAANPINRITNYCLVKGDTRAKIELQIRKKMVAGWKPYGGIAIAPSSRSSEGNNNYVQALVKFCQSSDWDANTHMD